MESWFDVYRGKMAAAVLILVPLILVVTSAGAEVGHEGSAPGSWMGATMGTVQAVVSGGVVTTTGWFSGMVSGSGLEAENQALREENARLREEKARLIGVLQENARLREMVGFQRQHPQLEVSPARVVGRDISPYFRVLNLEIESDADIEVRMPVVAAEGVVGQVHRVDGRVAQVVLVSDPRSHIDAISQRNRTLGTVQGLGHRSDYLAQAAYVTERDDLEVGDEMVTSGLGGVFPQDLRIGRVTSVEAGSDGMFQEVLVEPSVDVSRLREVFVVTGTK